LLYFDGSAFMSAILTRFGHAAEKTATAVTAAMRITLVLNNMIAPLG